MSLFFGGSSGNVLADRRYDFALQMAARGDYADAADLLRQGIDLSPAWPPLHFHLGDTLRLAGNAGGALKAFEQYLALDTQDHMGATVKLVLMGEAPAPETLPPAYVQSLFDQYAPRFEAALVDHLDYKTPKQIAQTVNRLHAGPFNRVLDLGCGTGLAAAEFAGAANWMEGIDLSPAMVEEARAKNLYHALHAGDIMDFLQTPRQPYDLILCADVLVYIGALEPLFSSLKSFMTPNSLFAFSIQSTDADGYILGNDHRYAHGAAHVARAIKNAGLKLQSRDDVILRRDEGRAVPGTVYLVIADQP